MVYIIIIIALIFDYVNGFHDAANSIATIVTTRVLPPNLAVYWAAFFNLIAFLFVGVAVAKTIGNGIVVTEVVNRYVILAALMGAILWDIITWFYGLPTSSSHALVGGFVGAAIAKTLSINCIIWSGIIKISLFIVISPLLGLILGSFFMTAIYWICRRTNRKILDFLFRKLQLLSAAAYSFGHGANDAQKTMGIIAVLLYASYQSHTLPEWLYNPPEKEFYVPFWVVIICQVAMALGTMAGGWKIVKTMGSRITKLRPVEGFCAETAGATTLLVTALLGIPVSTTHTITGSIAGVGAIKAMRAVRWKVATRIVWAWILTIPLSALIAAISYDFIHILGKIL
ncbi:MAG: Low-affinity inorganic phosphate transporter 1 [bacterium ADurb.Bin363]|nr:MAG: Low-affinity inorganic phosphate transporter 1 [bacterium ADurb.Bin363]